MKVLRILLLVTFISNTLQKIEEPKKCGCRMMRSCYRDMLKDLTGPGEAQCINDAIISTITIKVYLKAVKQYCGNLIQVSQQKSQMTHGRRELHEVVITRFNATRRNNEPDDTPVVIIEGGQDASESVVALVMLVMEQLLACSENDYMLTGIKWVFLPCTNPDGLEYARHYDGWTKNMNKVEDSVGIGVDITRNFDYKWDQCISPATAVSPVYSGDKAGSENETIFISDVLKTYAKSALVYISIREDGHGLYMPYAYNDNSQKLDNEFLFKKIIAYLAGKANRKSGNSQIFSHSTIFMANGERNFCGHSVDYAQAMGINAVEWRVFMDRTSVFLRPYHANERESLLSLYFLLLKEAHNVYIKLDKFKELFANEGKVE